MTDEQYKEIQRLFKVVTDNQVILGAKLNTLQADVETAIHNTKILARDQDVIMEDVKKIKNSLKR